MERCVCNRLYSHVSQSITSLQRGFMYFRSCSSQLLSVLHSIGEVLDKNKRQMFCTLILPRLSIQLTTPLLLKSWHGTVLRVNFLIGFLTTLWADHRESWLMAKPPCVYRSLLVYLKVALSAHSSPRDIYQWPPWCHPRAYQHRLVCWRHQAAP